MTPGGTKSAMRAAARGSRDGLSPADRAAASRVIAERAIAVIRQAAPAVVACYGPIRSEVDTADIVAWADTAGLSVALPSIEGSDDIVFRRHRAGEPLVENGFGTRAPHPQSAEIDPDLIVLPLVGFDRAGHRLGYGRGFYDRAIGRLRSRGARPLLLGIAFAVQEVPAIPSESHDVRLDWVVTERETLDFSSFD